MGCVSYMGKCSIWINATRFLNSSTVRKCEISDPHSSVAEGSNFLECYECHWVDTTSILQGQQSMKSSHLGQLDPEDVDKLKC